MRTFCCILLFAWFSSSSSIKTSINSFFNSLICLSEKAFCVHGLCAHLRGKANLKVYGSVISVDSKLSPQGRLSLQHLKYKISPVYLAWAWNKNTQNNRTLYVTRDISKSYSSPRFQIYVLLGIKHQLTQVNFSPSIINLVNSNQARR